MVSSEVGLPVDPGALPDRPRICCPPGERPARTGRALARQPWLGLAGLLLVVPVAVLLAVGAGGPEPSALVLGPLVTFALPAVAMIAFWWEDWPGSSLRPGWSGLVDTALVAVAAVLLTMLGQVVVGPLDVGAILDPAPGPGRVPTFPSTMPLAGAAFVAMLQLTFVCEGWPPTRRWWRSRRDPGSTPAPASWTAGSWAVCSCWSAGGRSGSS
jgi:hypothetical protein